MTPFCARILIFPCATLAAGIRATPGSSANGCGLWGVAWAWRQHATQPQETQPRLEPKNQCVHFVVSFTFFPLLAKKKKKKLLQNSDLSSTPPPKQSGGGRKAELKDSGQAGAGGGWPPGMGRQRVGVTPLQSLSTKQGKERLPLHCPRTVLSLQEGGKPRTNLTWFSPHGDCSPIQGCHSHATHWAELRWKWGLLQSV